MSQVINADTVREWGQRYSNWGRWGRDDERGALNFITPERVLEACALPRRGLVISCALPFDSHGPQTGIVVGPAGEEVHTDGYGRVKVKIKPGWEREPLEAIRRRFPALMLFADANAAYGLAIKDFTLTPVN